MPKWRDSTSRALGILTQDFIDIDDSRSGVWLVRSAGLEPGEAIADFEAIRKIGQGGMGTVYLCLRTNRDFEQYRCFLGPSFKFVPDKFESGHRIGRDDGAVFVSTKEALMYRAAIRGNVIP